MFSWYHTRKSLYDIMIRLEDRLTILEKQQAKDALEWGSFHHQLNKRIVELEKFRDYGLRKGEVLLQSECTHKYGETFDIVGALGQPPSYRRQCIYCNIYKIFEDVKER